MTSMYNLMHGVNNQAELAMALIGNPDVGRFRDAWLEMHEDEPRVAVYTRNGGGNRECWDDDCGDCQACLMSGPIPEHPQYLSDRDDEFDCTYATIYFSVPAEFRDDVAKIARTEARNMDDEWAAAIDALRESPTGVASERDNAATDTRQE